MDNENDYIIVRTIKTTESKRLSEWTIIHLKTFPKKLQAMARRFFKEHCDGLEGKLPERLLSQFSTDEGDSDISTIPKFQVDTKTFHQFERLWEEINTRLLALKKKSWKKKIPNLYDFLEERITWSEFYNKELPYLISKSLER